MNNFARAESFTFVACSGSFYHYTGVCILFAEKRPLFTSRSSTADRSLFTTARQLFIVLAALQPPREAFIVAFTVRPLYYCLLSPPLLLPATQVDYSKKRVTVNVCCDMSSAHTCIRPCHPGDKKALIRWHGSSNLTARYFASIHLLSMLLARYLHSSIPTT